MLLSWKTVPSIRRQSVLQLIDTFANDIDASRNIEASIHCSCRNVDEYTDKAQKIILNIKQNPKLISMGMNIVAMTDQKMIKGTILEDIERETNVRKLRFEQMLQEKYDMMNDKSYNTALKCRRCGSSEVSWDQKQTRSADEASTVFCTCNKCNNRWTMR